MAHCVGFWLVEELLRRLAVWPTECGEVARGGCLFAWTRSAVFTEVARGTRPITTLLLHYDFPSVCMYLHGSHWTDILYWDLLGKSVLEIQLWLHSDKNVVYLT